MLSDSMHEACETIWEAVENYNYSEDYKNEIVEALTNLGYIMYQLDRMKEDCKWTKEDYKNEYVLKRWSSRSCGKDYFNA